MEPVNPALRRQRAGSAEPTVDRLLAAARDVFAARGWADTSLDAVAAAADVTKGSLYHHFEDKRELFEATFEQEARRLHARIAEAVAQGRDPWDGARRGLRAFLDGSQDAAVQRIMMLEALSVLGWDRIREIEARYGLAVVKQVLRDLADAGHIPAHETDVLAHLFFGALAEGSLLIAQASDVDAARARVEREVRSLLEGLSQRA